jgi:hypothetical protein
MARLQSTVELWSVLEFYPKLTPISQFTHAVKRKRSLSPHDRYVRFRHDDPRKQTHSVYIHVTNNITAQYNRDRYSRSTGGRPVSLERRGPPDPTNRDAVATFRQYSEWFKFTYPDEWKEDDTAELSTVRTRYDDYRRAFIRKQVVHYSQTEASTSHASPVYDHV